MKLFCRFIFIVLGLTGCGRTYEVTSLPYFNSPDFTPEWISKTDAQVAKLHTIPPFNFTDQNGRVVSDKTTQGKIYVANFFFTRCTNICPKMTDNLSKVARAFCCDNRVLFISHSVTPQFDNVSVLLKYAREKNITNCNWHLVTGRKDEIYNIARKSYFADAETKEQLHQPLQFLHTENLILIDKHRHIRGVYNGTIAYEADNLIKHIKLLEQEE
jgi:protein SCO1/2